MHFANVSILSLAHVEAPHIITSESLEQQLLPLTQRFKMPPDLIRRLTGIKERRFWDWGTQPSDAASLAGARALEAAGLERSRVGVLVSTSVCKDFIEPSVAALVHGNLRLSPECLNFDLGNACLAFLNAMEVVGNMIERRQVDYGLIVDGEDSRFVVEQTLQRLLSQPCDEETLKANLATMTLGSGAVAMVLARSGLAPGGHAFLGGVSLAATEHSRLCLGQRDAMRTDAGQLLEQGVKLARQTYAKAQAELGWAHKTLDELVLHQVGAWHTQKLVQALGLDMPKIFAIYPQFGNIGPASIPFALAKAVEAGRLRPGHRVALMGIGSGLNCSMMEVLW